MYSELSTASHAQEGLCEDKQIFYSNKIKCYQLN